MTREGRFVAYVDEKRVEGGFKEVGHALNYIFGVLLDTMPGKHFVRIFDKKYGTDVYKNEVSE